MSLYKKHRVFSEKLTSIEDPIAVVQRGVITFVPSKGTKFLVPTFITNPVNLKLQPMSAVTAQAFGASAKAQTWYSDLKLYYATNAASSGFGSIASNVLLAEIGARLRLDASGNLYVAVASMAAGVASNTRLASTDYWRKLEEYGTNQRHYLVVNVPNSASAYFKAKKQSLAYEVIGYEY